MSATCAICQQPIVTRQDVRVSGTEIMHRSCAAAGGETIGWRQGKEIADLRRQLVQAQESAARAIASQREQREQWRSTTNVLSDLVRAHEETTAALATVTRERDTLRSELAKRPVVQQPSEPPPTQEEYGKDAEVRFSLLELDPV